MLVKLLEHLSKSSSIDWWLAR